MKYPNLISLLLLGLMSCQKGDELSQRDYPRLITNPTGRISANGAELNGEVLKPGRSSITDYGFLWNEEALGIPSLEKSERYSLIDLLTSGPFGATAEFGLKKDVRYSTRAYLRSGDYTVYGDEVRFVSQGCPPPTVSDFTPKSGAWGDTIAVQGDRFSFRLANVEVFFDTPTASYRAKLLRTSDRQVVCVVPDGVERSAKIRVVATGQSATAATLFTLTENKPIVTRISPELGTFGELVTLSGINFSPLPGYNHVRMGGVEVALERSTKTELLARVPTGLRKKNNEITVAVYPPGSTDTLTRRVVFPAPFVVKAPRLVTVNSTGNPRYVELRGENFNPDRSGNLVRILGSNPVYLTQATNQKLELDMAAVVFPTPGPLRVRLEVCEQTSELDWPFNPLATWTKRANDFIEPFNEISDWSEANILSTFTVNGRGYVLVTVVDAPFGAPTLLYEYNPTQFTWRRLADFPVEVTPEFASGFVIGSQFYVSTHNQERGNFWAYETTTNRWRALPDRPTCQNFTFGSRGAGFALNGKGYICAGANGICLNDFFEYDPSRAEWKAGKSLPDPAANFTEDLPGGAVVFGGNAYVLYRSASELGIRFHEYDPSSKHWTRRALLSVDLERYFTPFVASGQLYATDGQRVYQYSKATDSWQERKHGATLVRDDQYYSRVVPFTFEAGGATFLTFVDYQSILHADGTRYRNSFHVWQFDPTR